MNKLTKAYFKCILTELAAIKCMIAVILLANFMLAAALFYFIIIL